MCPASLPCPPVPHENGPSVVDSTVPAARRAPAHEESYGWVERGDSSPGPPKFGGRRCERGSAATRVCSREVEARSGAWPSNRVQVSWTQVCANGRSHTRCKAIISGLGPMRAPHMARSAIVFRRSDTFSNAIDDGLDFALIPQHGLSAM